MNAGALNEHIEIYTPHIIINEVGEQENEYILKNKTRARVIHNKGNRNIENDEIVYNFVKIFEVRIYVDIEEFDRIKWNDRYYRVLDIDPNKEMQKITVTTEVINE